MRRIAAARAIAVVLAVVSGGPAAAEIYRWTDAEGRLHFTHHLDEVPPDQRPGARAAASARARTPDRVQTYDSDGARNVHSVPASVEPRARGAATRRAYQIPVERAGTSMLVHVRLNDRVSAPFIIDTGASDVTVPKSVADELGFKITRETRTIAYTTANGVVQSPVVMLDAVDLGGARVENVPASISSSMNVGLLGLSFFNHFTYKIDAAAGLVTLMPNGLAESGLIRGGRSEAQWRAEYGNVRGRIAALDDERGRTPSSRHRELERLASERDRLERQLESLETEADSARVPVSWRE